MWAITLEEYLRGHLAVGVAVLIACGLLWFAVRKYSFQFRLRAGLILALTVVGCFAAGLIGWLVNPTTSHEALLTNQFHGMVFGFVSGLLISWFLWKYYQREIEGDEDAR